MTVTVVVVAQSSEVMDVGEMDVEGDVGGMDVEGDSNGDGSPGDGLEVGFMSAEVLGMSAVEVEAGHAMAAALGFTFEQCPVRYKPSEARHCLISLELPLFRNSEGEVNAAVEVKVHATTVMRANGKPDEAMQQRLQEYMRMKGK